jgi:arylsulfatase A-like enzyme
MLLTGQKSCWRTPSPVNGDRLVAELECRRLKSVGLVTRIISVLFVFLTACQGQPVVDHVQTTSDAAPKTAQAQDPNPVALEPEPEPEPVIELAESPRIDFLANRSLFYRFQEGLVLSFGDDDILKYSNEYSRPLGDKVDFEGKKGRLVSRASVALSVPWHGGEGPATVRIFVHGATKGQRVQLNINRERVGVLEAPQSWEELVFEVPEGLLKSGDNEFRLTMKASSGVQGKKTYGVFHALELIPGQAGSGEWPMPEAAVAAGLGGFPRFEFLAEIPASSFLRFEVEGPKGAKYRVLVRGQDGVEVAIADGTIEETPKVETIDLKEFSNRLLTLVLASEGTWKNAFIGLETIPLVQGPPVYDNVILMVVDALRADSLALYGNQRVQTPNWDAHARSGAVFLRNQAASPSSPPSHTSIQTGMIPRVHGVAGDKGKLNSNTPLISNQMKAAGISTAYVGNNSFGMNRLRAAGAWDEFHQPVSEGAGIDCTALVDEVLKFAKKKVENKERFFVSALPFEPHAPYRFHEGITEKYYDGEFGPPVGKFADGYLLVDVMAGRKTMREGSWDQLRALYDGEVEHMDQCFGQLLQGLDGLGIKDKTAIVLTSDHGEGMNEHGRLGHAYGHYAELANVPLVVFAPGWSTTGPVNVPTVTSHVDVAPTVLGLAGVKPSEKIQGRDVMPLTSRENWTPRVVSTEYGRSYSLRSQGWRLIVNYDGTQELYDEKNDPLEQRNLVEEDLMALRYLRGLAGVFLEYRSEWKVAESGDWNNRIKAD